MTGNPVSFVDPFGLEGIVLGDDIYGPTPHSKLATTVVIMTISSTPGIGEGLDIDVLFGISQPSTGWEKLGAASSLLLSVVTATISPNYGAWLRCGDEIYEVANKFNILECEECAEAIINVLKKHGVENSKVIEFYSPGNDFIWHDGLGKVISNNGRHVAVEVDGIIYDNIHKNGIPRAEWENLFITPHGGFETFEVLEHLSSKWLEELYK